MSRLAAIRALFAPPRWLRVRLRAGRARRRREHERHWECVREVARGVVAEEVAARTAGAVSRSEVAAMAIEALGPSLKATRDSLATVLDLVRRNVADREGDRREVDELIARMEQADE